MATQDIEVACKPYNCHKEREVRKYNFKDIKGLLTFDDAFDDPSDFPLSCSVFFENMIWS